MSEKKKRGPKSTGRPRARGINFSVSAEHEVWLHSLNNRSEWLAQQIDKALEQESKDASEDAPRSDQS